ncbi:MAG: M12 family metallo-peptidase [Planctomycetota bacterium]
MRCSIVRCSMASVTATTALFLVGPTMAQQTDPVSQPTTRSVVRLESPIREIAAHELGAGGSVPAQLQGIVALLEVDEKNWQTLASVDDALLTGLPIAPGQTVDVLVHRRNPLEDTQVVSASRDVNGQIVDVLLASPALTCFGGSLVNDPSSRVMIARHESFLIGFVITDEGRWIISSGATNHNGPLVAFRHGALPSGTLRTRDWSCETLLPPDERGDAGNAGRGDGGGDEGGIAGSSTCRQSRIAVETDHEFLLLFGGNQGAAAAYVATLFSALTDIYSRDVGLRPSPCFIRLWPTASDPWDATSTSSQLYQFRDQWQAMPPSVQRNSATFLSGRGLGGGVAWLNAGCGSYAYSVSANLGGSFPYPLVDNSWDNWDIMVVAHELGHNYGAPHTHSYTPPADGCGSDPQDCTAANNDEGTIMSYCHICDGGMSNVDMRFHPMSISSITSYIGGGSCNFSPSAQPPAALPDYRTCLAGAVIDIDVLANDLALNCDPITSISVAQPGSGASAVVVPGAGPNGRSIVRFTAPGGSTASLTFPYTVVESSGLNNTANITVDIQALRYPENPGNSAPGVIASYYQLAAPQVLPDFTTLTQYAGGIVSDINFASTGGNFATSGRAEEVGAVFRGWINIPTSGFWTLFTNSDDGSRLLIGQTAVVNNDGLHAMVERSGTIALAAGRHAITVEFFENGGGAGLITSWQGPGVAKAVVPASAWSRGGTYNWADVNRNGMVDGADLSLLLAAWGTFNIPADINQDGIVSGVDLAALLAAWGS